MGELKQKVFTGAIWLTLERLGTQAVEFGLGMVLARLLTPADYGTVALVGIFFVVARSLADSGLGTALIQKKTADAIDFNSVFYASITLSLTVYAVLFFAAPYIADFYHAPELANIVRVMGVTIIFFAVNSVQNAELTRQMRFGVSCLISMIVCGVNAVSGVTLAFMGYGPWALVFSAVITGVVSVLIRWFVIAWRPGFAFSFIRLRELVSYGWKIAASDLLGQFSQQLNGMMVGKFYTRSDIAFVDRGSGLPTRALLAIENSIGGAAFPALAQFQDDFGRIVRAMRRISQCSVFLVFPILAFIAANADSLIYLLFGEKWLPATPYMRISCLACALWPLIAVNQKVLMVMGRSGVLLAGNIVLQIVGILILLVFLRYSVLTFVLAGALLGGPCAFFFYWIPNRLSLGYRFGHVLVDILPIAVLSLVSILLGRLAFRVLGVSLQPEVVGMADALIRLAIQFSLVFCAYFGMSWMVRSRPLGEYLGALRTWASGKSSKCAHSIVAACDMLLHRYEGALEL